MKTTLFLFISSLFISVSTLAQEKKTIPDYLNTDLTFELRVNDIVSRMTLEEKVSQMLDGAKPIERLGVPETGGTNVCTVLHVPVQPRSFHRQLRWQPHSTPI